MSSNVKAIILKEIDENGTVKVGELQTLTGLSRQGLHHHLKALIARGEIRREGAGRGAHYLLGSTPASPPPTDTTEPPDERPTRSLRFELGELEEHTVWKAVLDTGSLKGLEKNSLHLIGYAVNEMVNNAIDHSGGDDLELTLSWRSNRLHVTVADDGVGAFAHLRDYLGLTSELAALQEVTKGKVTTDPERHSGEGLFFTSRAVDHFELRSGQLRWIVDNLREDQAIGMDERILGTIVRFDIDPAAPRDLDALFAFHTSDDGFYRTQTVVKLFEHGVLFVSRSEARRMLHGLERFQQIVVDFQGIDQIGQGFADEVFRVWARAHPEHRLEPANMNAAITLLVERARRA